MFGISEYKLTDLLSSAGTIFLQFLSSKYTELFRRYSELTKEYRGRTGDEPRHTPLREEIQVYHRRLRLLNWASLIAGGALIAFLLAVLAGGFSMAYPQATAFKIVGTGGLCLGLCLIGVAVGFELWECILTRQEIGAELADLDPDAKQGK